MADAEQCDYCDQFFTPAQMGGHLHSGPCAVQNAVAQARGAGPAAGDANVDGAHDAGREDEPNADDEYDGYEDMAAHGPRDESEDESDGDAGAHGGGGGAVAPQSPKAIVDAAVVAIQPLVLSEKEYKLVLDSVTDYMAHCAAKASFEASLRLTSNRAALRSAARIVEDNISKRQWDGITRPSLIAHDRRSNEGARMTALDAARSAGATPGVLSALDAAFDTQARKRPQWMEFRAVVNRVRNLCAPLSAVPTVHTTFVPSFAEGGGQPTEYNTTIFPLRSLVRDQFEAQVPSGTYRIPHGPPTEGAVDLCDSPFLHNSFAAVCDRFAANRPVAAALNHAAILLGFPGGIRYIPWPVALNEDGTRSSTRRLVDGASIKSMLGAPHAQDCPELVSLAAIFQKNVIAQKTMKPREQMAHARNYQDQWKLLFDEFSTFRERGGFLLGHSFPGGPPHVDGSAPVLNVFEPILCTCCVDNESSDKITGTNQKRCTWCIAPHNDLNVYPLPPSAIAREHLAREHRTNLADRKRHADNGAPSLDARRAVEEQSDYLCLSFKYPPVWPSVEPSPNILFSHKQHIINNFCIPEAFHVFTGIWEHFGDLVCDRIREEGDVASFDASFNCVARSPGYFNDGCRVHPTFYTMREGTSGYKGDDKEIFLRALLATLVLSEGRESGLTVEIERDMSHVLELAFYFHSKTSRVRSPPSVLAYLDSDILPNLFTMARLVFTQASDFAFRKFHTLAHMTSFCRAFGSMRNHWASTFEHHNKLISSTGLSVSHAHRSSKGLLQHAMRYWFVKCVQRMHGVLDGGVPRIPPSLTAPPAFSAPAPAGGRPIPAGSQAHARVTGVLAGIGAAPNAIANVLAVPYASIVRCSHGRPIFHGSLRSGHWVRLRQPASPDVVLARVYDVLRDTVSGNLFLVAAMWEPAFPPTARTPHAPPNVTHHSKSSFLHEFVRQCAPAQFFMSPITDVQGRALVWGDGKSFIWAPELEPQEYA
jgi:hypothetical protein